MFVLFVKYTLWWCIYWWQDIGKQKTNKQKTTTNKRLEHHTRRTGYEKQRFKASSMSIFIEFYYCKLVAEAFEYLICHMLATIHPTSTCSSTVVSSITNRQKVFFLASNKQPHAVYIREKSNPWETKKIHILLMTDGDYATNRFFVCVRFDILNIKPDISTFYRRRCVDLWQTIELLPVHLKCWLNICPD